MKVSIYREPMGGLSILLFEENKMSGKTYVVKPVKIEFVEIDESSAIDPTIKLSMNNSHNFLQSLADAIDEYGIRPSKKPPLENELSAVKYHLEDMRKLVFKETE